MSDNVFGRAKKDTLHVNIYEQVYERDYSNRVGPGPGAYAHLYQEVRETDRFKQTAFGKKVRDLTMGLGGPGPNHYST